MKLHIFNPEHDLALAAGVERFTPPHAGRALRHDLGFLPALWSQPGDCVLVDDVDEAVRAVEAFRSRFPAAAEASVVSRAEVGPLLSRQAEAEVWPWGWDSALRRQLTDAGVPDRFLPADRDLALVRAVSNRKWAAEKLLPQLVAMDDRLVGTAHHFTDMDSLQVAVGRVGRCLCKAPWSSRGRGLCPVGASGWSAQQAGWLRHVIREQGGVMLEPYYQREHDFGMEFRATRDGIVYEGLSLFATRRGAYAGNFLATEAEKQSMLARWVPPSLTDRIRDRIISILEAELPASFTGPFGVDMMIVSEEAGRNHLRVHPCVELNLRMTMGHVAIALSPAALGEQSRMRITYDGRYHLVIEPC